MLAGFAWNAYGSLSQQMGPETFLVKIVKRLLTPCQHGFTVALHVGGAHEMATIKDALYHDHPALGDVRQGPDGREYIDCARCGFTISASHEKDNEMAFEIISRSKATGNEWHNDEIGEPNVFETEAEAWAAIEELRKLGEDWATAEYDVREICAS